MLCRPFFHFKRKTFPTKICFHFHYSSSFASSRVSSELQLLSQKSLFILRLKWTKLRLKWKWEKNQKHYFCPRLDVFSFCQPTSFLPCSIPLIIFDAIVLSLKTLDCTFEVQYKSFNVQNQKIRGSKISNCFLVLYMAFWTTYFRSIEHHLNEFKLGHWILFVKYSRFYLINS